MSKKLMLLAAGVLSALALTALPSAASAGEPTMHCTTLPCTYTVTGTGNAVLTSSFGAVTCKSTGTAHSPTGNGSMNALSGTTGAVQLLFHDCHEPFGTTCQSAGQPAGTITTNSMVTHNVYIDTKVQVPNGTPGILITNPSVTFSCGIGLRVTVTGNVIGHLEDSTTKCNTPTNEFTLNFTETGGSQTYKQVTTTGTVFDLIASSTLSATHSTSYGTSGQTGTAHIKFNQNVTLTC